MTQKITMGSLFSGSGGFELAGSIFGIRPIWASEIEPFPILVTTKNFPEMKHLGDINKLNGADLEPVTIIAGGSPCQDMSIAGKREGLDGSRSNLFREQIRIIKEMRERARSIQQQQGQRLPGSPPRNRQHHRRRVQCTSPSEGKMADSRMHHGRPFHHRLASA